MDLTYRPAEARDLAACVDLLPEAFECDPGLKARLPGVWRRWLQEDRMVMAVIEDGLRPPAARLVGFGASVFVTDEFAQEAKTTGAPYPTARIVQRWLAGDAPLLDADGVRRANSGEGLTQFVTHCTWRPALAPDEARLVKATLIEALLFFYRGYRLNELLQEVYSEEERARGEAIGAWVINDYRAFYATHPEALPPPDRRPYLIGISREEVRDGSYGSPLFFYSPPRFFLKPGEQAMLQLALLGRADGDMAQALNVSLSTVHKRWRAVSERAARVAPELFPDDELRPEHGRGHEKRRRLLNYLRTHLEEMRPVSPPKAAVRSWFLSSGPT